MDCWTVNNVVHLPLDWSCSQASLYALNVGWILACTVEFLTLSMALRLACTAAITSHNCQCILWPWSPCEPGDGSSPRGSPRANVAPLDSSSTPGSEPRLALALLSAASNPPAALQAAEDDPPSAIAPGSAQSRPRRRHDARRPCAKAGRGARGNTRARQVDESFVRRQNANTNTMQNSTTWCVPAYPQNMRERTKLYAFSTLFPLLLGNTNVTQPKTGTLQNSG